MLDMIGAAIGIILIVATAAALFFGTRWLWCKVVVPIRGMNTNWRWLSTRALLDARHREVISIRRDLWRAVAGTERAVELVRADGAPLGDLPSLARRLRGTVEDLDHALQVAERSALADADGTLSRDAQALLSAADHIMRSAAIALRSGSSPAVRVLLDDTRQELTAFSTTSSSP